MPRKVLVVDDEKQARHRTVRKLESAGCGVITANNGEEAIQIALSQLPDLIVLDDAMPVMDGLTTLQKLKSNILTRDIPVIALLENYQDSEVFKFWKAGAECYLAKPYDLDELAKFVANIFEKLDKLDP